MQPQVQVTFRNTRRSTSLENAVERRIARIRDADKKLKSCRLVLETCQPVRRKPDHFHVRLIADWNGRKILVGNRHSHKVNQDAYSAILDAFNTLEKRIRHEGEKNGLR